MAQTVPGYAYEYDQPLYDTMQLAAVAGPKEYSFFSLPKGGVLVGTTKKGFEHTNLIQPAMLETGRYFTALGMFMYVRESASGGAVATLADYQVLQGGWLELKVAEKECGRWPCPLVPSGGCDLNYFSNITPAATEFRVNRGINATSNIRAFSHPIEIDPQVTIEVVLTVPGTIAAVIDVTFAFAGIMRRPA